MYQILNVWNRFRDYVTAALGIGLVVTSLGWYVTDLKLDSEIEGRANDKLRYENAQKEYETRALNEKIRIENENRDRAKEADKRYSDLLGQYNSRLVRFRSAQSTNGGADLSRTPGTAESSDGPSPSTELPLTVIITYEDAEICAENTARIKAVQEWATK